MKDTPGLRSWAQNAREDTRRKWLLSDLVVAFPAKVIRYDAATREAEIEPMILHVWPTEDGARELTAVPPIPNVLVLFPGGPSTSITWPLRPGDHVLGVGCDQYLGAFLAGREKVAPPFDWRHSFASVVCFPVWFAQQAAVQPTSEDLEIRHSGNVVINGGESFLARADRVDADIAAIKAWLATHVHTGVTTGGASSGPPPPGEIVTSGSASDSVKGA